MPEIPQSIKVEILRCLNVEELLDVAFTSKIYLEISKFIFSKDYDDFKLIIFTSRFLVLTNVAINVS